MDARREASPCPPWRCVLGGLLFRGVGPHDAWLLRCGDARRAYGALCRLLLGCFLGHRGVSSVWLPVILWRPLGNRIGSTNVRDQSAVIPLGHGTAACLSLRTCLALERRRQSDYRQRAPIHSGDTRDPSRTEAGKIP